MHQVAERSASRWWIGFAECARRISGGHSLHRSACIRQRNLDRHAAGHGWTFRRDTRGDCGVVSTSCIGASNRMLWLTVLLLVILAGTAALGGLVYGTINVISLASRRFSSGWRKISEWVLTRNRGAILN
jgi:hypothetical protein